MINSRVRPFRGTSGLAGLSTLLTLLVGSAALAAGPTPIHNGATGPGPADGAPTVAEAPPPDGGTIAPAEPAQGSVGAGFTTVGARPGVNEATVQVGTLGAPDPGSMGLLDAGEDGLPASAWVGSTRADADRLLADGPQPTTSRALQALGRKVLLSRVEPPKGAADGSSFLTLRLRRLLALGDLDAVMKLGGSIPVAAKTSGEQRVRADAFLITNDETSACQLAAAMRRFNADPYWVKLGAYCAVHAGQTETAELAVNLLRLNSVDDPAFYDLYEKLAVPGSSVVPAPLTADSPPLLRVMARAAGTDAALPAKLLEQPVYQRLRALSTGGTSDQRLAAALAAAKLGALPVSALPPLFALQTFTESQVGYPESAAASVEAPRVPALLYQSVQVAAAPEPRLTRILAAFRAARARGFAPVMAELLVPQAEPIIASPDFVNSAPEMVEFYLTARASTPAYDWFAAIDNRRDVPSLTKTRFDHLALLLQISARNERFAWEPKEAKRIASRAKKAGGDALAQRAFEIQLLSALGYEVDPDLWEDLPPMAGGDPALTPTLAAFEQAVASGRIAEGALLALDVLAKPGPQGAPKGAVVSVVRGLKSLGLEADARAIALEAAIGLSAGGA